MRPIRLMPQDVAGAILFLASDRASYVNGDQITVEIRKWKLKPRAFAAGRAFRRWA